MKDLLKKMLKRYYEHQHLLDITGGFMLILAFVITLPTLIEMQMGLILMLIILSIGIKMMIGQVATTFPELYNKAKKEYITDSKLKKVNDEIKSIKRRLKKIEKNKEKK